MSINSASTIWDKQQNLQSKTVEINEEIVTPSIQPLFNSELQIDSEFKNLIPPLSVEEKTQLEANLKEFGCIDPLVVWKDKSIILDGHYRYEICTKNQIQY